MDVRVPDHVEWRSIDDEVVVLDTRTELFLSLNDTAAVVWRGIAEGASRTELVGRLTGSFEVDAAVAQSDIETFVNDLSARGLLVDGDQGDAAG